MTIEIDHIGLSVSDFEAAKKFYAAALAPLRMSVLMEFPASVTGNHPVAGLGADGKPFLWISEEGRTVPHAHIAIRAESRDQVDAFYAAAMAAGATDNGAPGLRPHYHQHYYGAFVLDADGHNIEAVCHAPPAAAKPARRKAPARKTAAKKAGRKAAKKAARKPVRKAAAKKGSARKPAARRTAKKATARRRTSRR